MSCTDAVNLCTSDDIARQTYQVDYMLTTLLQDTRRSCFAGSQALLIDVDYLLDLHKVLDALCKPDRVLQLPEGKIVDPPNSPYMNSWASRRLYPLAPAARDHRTQVQCSMHSWTASTHVSILPIPYIALLCLHCVQAHAGRGALLRQPIYDADSLELHGCWQQHRLEPVC